jgi:alpha-beta hydrolase superfamily lysophospholipase
MTACCATFAARASAESRETVAIRGHSQLLHVYGERGGTPFIVSSGDGGWIHLGPHVAEVLAANGCFVVGFDVKAYLESFTGAGTLRPEDVPGDYKVLAEFAAKGGRAKPMLIGVSEGAGLSVLAAADAQVKSAIGGVIGLGLPDRNELGWRWKDSIIYLTHEAPHEPWFSAAAVVQRLAPVPLAAIHSTHDEFVPIAELHQVFDRASSPKRLWIIDAANHRFSDKLAEFDYELLDAINWIAAQGR